MSEALRQLTDWMGAIIDGDKDGYMLVGVKKGKIDYGTGAVKVIKKNKDGTMLIKPLRAGTASEKVRLRMAHEITNLFKADIESQAQKAVDELKNMKAEILDAIHRGERPQISGSRGCMYLSYGKGKAQKDILL